MSFSSEFQFKKSKDMINAQGKHVAYSGGNPYVLVKDGKKLIQIPIDPATQQFACEIKTTFYHQYIAGIIDKRYRRRGLDDRSYFLNVLTARANPTMQGFMLLGKSICLFTPIYNFIDQGKWWDWEDTFDIEGFIRAIEAKLKEKNS